MTENKFELQSYFILYLLFVRILNLSKDIVSFLHISNFFFVNERVIEKYGRVRCINIFADYGFCVFHMCWPWFRRGQFSFSTIWFIWWCPYMMFAVFWNLTAFPVLAVMFFSGNFFSSWNRFWKYSHGLSANI